MENHMLGMGWDPMRDDYTNPSFNSYIEGPGSRLDQSLQPGARHGFMGAQEFKLFVGRLPCEVTERGMINLFLEFGDILDVYKAPSLSAVTWGFVTLSTYQGAELAIRKLNGTAPLFLSVQFARSETEKQRLRDQEMQHEHIRAAMERIPHPYSRVAPGSFHNRPITMGRGRGVPMGFRSNQWTGYEGDLMASDPYSDLDKTYYDMYNEGVYDGSNRAVSQLVVMADRDGRRVSKGRGLLSPNQIRSPGTAARTPWLPRAIEMEIAKHVKVKDGRYEYGKPPPDMEQGPCYKCGSSTTLKCASCNTFYCSDRCQHIDWPEHMKTCSKSSNRMGDNCQRTNQPPKVHQQDFNKSGSDDRNKMPATNTTRQDGANRNTNMNYSSRNNFSRGPPNRGDMPDEANGSRNDGRRPPNRGDMPDEANGSRNDGRRPPNRGDMPDEANGSRNDARRPPNRGDMPDEVNSSRNDGRRPPNRGDMPDEVNSSRNDGRRPPNRGDMPDEANGSRNDGRRPPNRDQAGYDRNQNQRGNWAQRREQGGGGETTRDGFKKWDQQSGPQRNEDNQNQRNSNIRSQYTDQGNNSARRGFNSNQGSFGQGDQRKGSFQNRGNFNTGGNNNRGVQERLSRSQQESSSDNKKTSASNEEEDWNAESGPTTTTTTATASVSNVSVEPRDTVAMAPNASAKATAPVSTDPIVTAQPTPANVPTIPVNKVCSNPAVSSNEFCKVNVSVPVAACTYWVTLADTAEQQLWVMKRLLEIQNEPPVPCTPAEGLLCGALYEDMWYRAKVVSTKPLTVFFIDFGNVEEVTLDKLRTIPEDVKEIPSQAIKIQLCAGTSDAYKNLQFGAELSVKAVGKDGEATLVKVEGDSSDSPSAIASPRLGDSAPPVVSALPEGATTPSGNGSAPAEAVSKAEAISQTEAVNQADGSTSLKSLITFMEQGQESHAEVVSVDGKEMMVTAVVPACVRLVSLVLVDLAKEMKNTANDTTFKPCRNELVAVPVQDKWCRALVVGVTEGKYDVALMDEGKVVRVSEVRRLPNKYRECPCLALMCKVTEMLVPEEKLKGLQDDVIKFVVTGLDGTKATCMLRDPEGMDLAQATMCSWEPPQPVGRLQGPELSSGALVVISAAFNQNALYIRPVGPEQDELFQCLLQRVAKHCVTAEPLHRMPVKRELVACKFAVDGNFYRAVVKNVKDKDIQVAYIDFGNEEVVTLDRLKSLSDELKKVPCSVLKVGLKGVMDKPLSVDAATLLTQAQATEMQFRITLPGPILSGVILTLPDGTSLNDKLNDLLEPGWKRAVAAGEKPQSDQVFCEDGMKYAELPAPGKEFRLVVLHVAHTPEDAILMGCEVGTDMMQHVHLTLQNQVNEYCNSVPEEAYTPRFGEMCLAKFDDGAWYRAICLENRSSEASVSFIDFGNVALVAFKNIRKMIQDFAEFPAIAVSCYLNGLKHTAAALKRVTELVPTNYIGIAKVVKKINEGEYEVDIPDVSAKLREEGLMD